MHINTTRKCCALLLLFIKLSIALDYADFGLPNKNSSCILTFNQTVYIFNQQSLSLKFNKPWSDTIPPTISKLDNNNIITAVDACSITSSGKVILIPPLQQQQPLQVLDDINIPWILNNNITYLGSQNAIDTFITKTVTISTQFAITTFNDYIIFYNGNQTFSLDTRYETLWTFYEILDSPKILNETPLLYATSRWILSFRNEPYIISIDCFDPYSFHWQGTILNFNTTFDARYSIQAVVPVVSSATIESDSLLIIVAGTQGATNNHAETSTGFWKLDISTSIPNNFTLTKLNPAIHQSDVVVFMTDLVDDGHSGPVVVTPLDDEMTLFYGGAKQLQFLNTTTLTFIPQPQWLTNTTTNDNNNTKIIQNDDSQPGSDHRLAIILGTVLGGLFFICIAILLFWCCRRKQNNQNNVLLRLNNNNNNNNNNNEEKIIPSKKKELLLLLGKKPKRAEQVRHIEESPSISQFTLSPIVPLSPINLFPLPSDAPSSNSVTAATTADEGIIALQSQPKLLKSRFREIFYYHSFPHTSSNATIDNQHITTSQSLPLESASANRTTTTNNGEPQNIPRSTSSYV